MTGVLDGDLRSRGECWYLHQVSAHLGSVVASQLLSVSLMTGSEVIYGSSDKDSGDNEMTDWDRSVMRNKAERKVSHHQRVSSVD